MIVVERQGPAGAAVNRRTSDARNGRLYPNHEGSKYGYGSTRSIENLYSRHYVLVYSCRIQAGKNYLDKRPENQNIGNYYRVQIFEKYLEFRAWFAGSRRSTDETAWLLPGAAHDGGGG
ncbi:hypothetical protein [Prosthecodimorpha staleyi]|uniref:Uncharacterized protein n=1 Tax=Prosthecodimorpha staleyi TaxID=2840188 RepID=A0A947D3J9_9HYPH|nr:hypothetical protein [Prosthecodimorpha staleyi]MBT9289658.1 hypothetical protein [Prosthecodimorpha staleyi]